MNWKRIVGIVLVVLGATLYLFSNYIADQVAQGKQQIAQGQKKVDTIRGVSELSPYTKDLGARVAAGGQKKIDKGKEDVRKYQKVANTLHLSGIILVIVGIAFFSISFKPKQRR